MFPPWLTVIQQVQGHHGVGTWSQKPPYATYKSPYGPKSVLPPPILRLAFGPSLVLYGVKSADKSLRQQLPHRPQLPRYQRRASYEIVRLHSLFSSRASNSVYKESRSADMGTGQWFDLGFLWHRGRHICAAVLFRGAEGEEGHNAGTRLATVYYHF